MKISLIVLILLLFNLVIFSAEGYYKDLFMDGGVGLNSRMTLPAADDLGYDYEYLADEDTFTNNIIIVTNSQDDNGFLLYPDGSPRFKMIFSNGGNADIHGSVLGVDGRERMREFYFNGGSYTGSCAGAILATLNTNTWQDPNTNMVYYNIWPGRAHFTQLADSYTDLKIPGNSPLWQYQDFGSDSIVEQVLHNGGVFVKEDDNYYWADGTELLGTYDSTFFGSDTEYIDFFDYGSVWAYKESEETGRIVVTGSHPEGVDWGDQLLLMKSILQYAMDGAGYPSIKGELTKGVERFMDDNSSVGYEKIGDKQIHHFTIDLKKDEPLLSFHLNGTDGYRFNMYINKDTFAFKNTALYMDTSYNSDKEISVENITAGTWYIGIECDTTILAKKHSWGYTYEGSIELMNGISYSVLADNKTGSKTSYAKLDKLNPPAILISSENVIIENAASSFKIELFDLKGRNIWNLVSEDHNSSKHQVQIPHKISSGIFILRYSDNNNSINQKIISGN